MVIDSPELTPVGVTKLIVWFDGTLGAESESVSLTNLTFAASAKRNVGRPKDHNKMASPTTEASAWSSPNVEFVLLMTLHCISQALLRELDNAVT